MHALRIDGVELPLIRNVHETSVRIEGRKPRRGAKAVLERRLQTEHAFEHRSHPRPPGHTGPVGKIRKFRGSLASTTRFRCDQLFVEVGLAERPLPRNADRAAENLQRVLLRAAIRS